MARARIPTLAAPTGGAIVNWIKALPAKARSGHKTALEAACWWAAYRMANDWLESNNTKDWAHVIRAGWAGVKTVDDVDSYLEGYLDGSTSAEITATIQADLANFWLGVATNEENDDE